MLKDRVALFKDSFAGLREALLVVLLLIVLIRPEMVQQWLAHAKLGEVGMFGLTLKQATAASRESVEAANQLAALKARAEQSADELVKLKASLDALAASGAAPSPAVASIVSQVATLSKSVDTTARLADGASTRNAQAVAAQGRTVAALGGKADALAGWTMAGRVDATGRAWTGTPNIDATTPDAIGDSARFTTATYVRSLARPASGPDYYSRRDVIGALAAGETASVAERMQSPARGGGAFLWLRVTQR